MTDYLATPGMIVDQLLPLVLEGERLVGGQAGVVVPLGTLTTAVLHLARLEKLDQADLNRCPVCQCLGGAHSARCERRNQEPKL